MANNIARLNSSIQNVALAKMRVSPNGQRALNPGWVDSIAAEFDPEMIGLPVLNLRKGYYYIIDGQHRVEGVKKWLGDDWQKQNVTCRVYVDLPERDEAIMFLTLNRIKTVSAFDKFKVAVTGALSDEAAVKKAVESSGLHVAREKEDGNVSCVSTLLKVYRRADANTVSRALRIAHESFGHQGMTNQVIDGVAMVCERYNGELRDDEVIERLHSMRGGVGALMNRARVLRNQTATAVPVCVAAAVVEHVNRGRGGKKLPAWWKE